MPEKAVYSLTEQGEKEFEKLMLETAAKSINIYLDFNAVIVNLDGLPQESQEICLTNIENNIRQLKTYLEENLLAKENAPDVPENGMAVLQQQFILAQAIETWISSLLCDGRDPSALVAAATVLTNTDQNAMPEEG